jgi:hypothetical protein
MVLLLAKVASADVTIDNFSCPDSVTLDGPAGATAFNAKFISCPGSLDGFREDFIANLTGNGASGGSASSVSTITTNPPAGAITGTFGSGITGFEGIQWGVQSGVFLLNLNLVGDSILVQIQSNSAGSLLLLFGQNLTNSSTFGATFSGGPNYQDVLIPLTNPTVTGTGWNMADVTQILLDVKLDTPGATWSIDEARIVTPEPSALLLTGICLLGVVTKSLRRRSAS